jgi:hypothetical protein
VLLLHPRYERIVHFRVTNRTGRPRRLPRDRVRRSDRTRAPSPESRACVLRR